MAVTTEELVREEIRGWLAENWDPDLTLADWWKRLAESGWAVPTGRTSGTARACRGSWQVR